MIFTAPLLREIPEFPSLIYYSHFQCFFNLLLYLFLVFLSFITLKTDTESGLKEYFISLWSSPAIRHVYLDFYDSKIN